MNLYRYANANPVNWADMNGLTPTGSAIGGTIGSVVGGWGGSIIGGLVGGAGGGLAGTTVGPAGTVIGAGTGGTAGATWGGAVGATGGALAGVWLGDQISNIFANESNDGTADHPPASSKPIDQTPWSGDHTVIKGEVGAGPADNVKISPNGNVWVENPDGTWTDYGPASDYTGSGKPSGQRGKDRKCR